MSFWTGRQPVTSRPASWDEFVELLVVDRGPGMPVALREAVLAPFDRLSGEQLNAGLNLTVASGFVAATGWSAFFEDTPGGGLTVAVDLPLKVRCQ